MTQCVVPALLRLFRIHELDLNSPFPGPLPARDDASSKRGCEESAWDIELNKTAALGNIYHGRRLASIDLPNQGNVFIPLQRITQGRHRRLTITQLQVPQRNDVDTSFLPSARLLTRYAGDTLCRELRDDGAGGPQAQCRGKVAVFVFNLIEPGAGLERSDTPEVTFRFPSAPRGCANIFPDTVRLRRLRDEHRSRTYEGAVTLAQRTQSGHVYPSNQARIRFSPRRAFWLTLGWSGLAACPIWNAGAQHLPGAARPRSGVAALHPHAAQGHRRACHQLDAYDDPADPGGMRAEVKGKQFDLVQRRERPRMAEAPPHHDPKATSEGRLDQNSFVINSILYLTKMPVEGLFQ
ncbi:hypothetical protein EDB83DRAFT_2323657 [Lactarius deliciosus]|nr:hypothetical protein EDB83DRAFT_2323657 [Lactarius deliciosus]